MSKLKTYEVKIKIDSDKYFDIFWRAMDNWPSERMPIRQFIFDDYAWHFIIECTEEQMTELKKKLNIK